MKLREIARLTWLPVVGASLCCLSPIVVVLLGLGSVTFASSLADTLYHDYKWVFRSVGLLLLVIAVVWHFRKKGVCTLNQAKRHTNEILNTVLITLFAGVLGYVLFLYVVVHYVGVWLLLWA
ncbi:hypothetical protein COU78_00410 [Candidatus Peregrinibacteria bacterium CG10_big_fil_rev_8_21_14_0_10_49_24]|nr:MAG: hypothetical protein COV83_06455 [Candidatus Peregrinibacteria bacterium CG11_big_fil_rev_8_21_14_0_20_49_14]PIR51649.1 MAG: hypothetical protein COU78_00410 [Candidatus Peregrinibacteria bacterium CG10_big_fil_rev_8_21_14_0_10_49_24]PJA67991.1 MAG: hypothetical protein CO157_01550 [Candidatus Peregrinibacteria bacterium CG_4_9_14_3_um_filter_49_12]